MDSGIRLQRDGSHADLDSLDDINAFLATVGTRIWLQDYSELSADLKDFLADPAPSTERVAEVKPQFLLSRERLLAIIAESGREPRVPGGGELTTLDETHGVPYPQLYVVRTDTDFSRFDRFHVNLGSTDDVPVDDVVQLLWGSGLAVHQMLPSGEIVKLHLDCPKPYAGWLLSVDCGIPFIGSFSSAAPGSKALSQVLGAARWKMVYVD